MDYQVRIQELELLIEQLPPGYITRKKIHGRIYCYHQWNQDGKTVSHIVKDEEIPPLQKQIDARKTYQKELKDLRVRMVTEERIRYGSVRSLPDCEMRILTGRELEAMARTVEGWQKRDCFSSVWDYLMAPPADRVCLLYGLRRTASVSWPPSS